MQPKSKELKRGVVTYAELIFQSISFTAPAIAVTATMTGAAAFAYGSLPLTYVLALFGVLSAGFVVYAFSRKVASSGGYYRYIERGLGPRFGAFGGWVYMLYTVIGATPFIYFETALAAQYGLEVFGLNVPNWFWYPVGILVGVLAYLLAYSGIKNSLKYSVYTGTAEILILVAVAVAILAATPDRLDFKVFTPAYSPTGWSGVALGLVFSFTSLAGWGSMTFLGTEAHKSHLNIRRGVVLTILVLGLLFLFESYAMTVGWGPQNMGTYFGYFLPGLVLALRDGGFVLAALLFVFLVNSGFVDTLAIINAGSRDMYTMSKDGLLPDRLSDTHPTHRSPHIALLVNTLVGIFLFTVTGWLFGPLNGFLITGLWTGAGTIIEHILVNTSLPLYFKRLGDLRWTYVAIPPIATAIYIFALYGSFLSINIYILIGVGSMVAWLVAGALIYSVKKDIRVRLEEGEEI
ncbi:amino acid transporter [Candidatus Marsarchaeota G2 archaeon ECH_B_2]|uniref:Amino acid transporter n=3 Tax=Candidatus Marsarchaeota group 2 TaxID=2203771 RepID=A0A2R6B6Y2_9ARCH|nr:MAG: amino acid transporter [Candidatus Marsarchaeota G2 archaeon ECH_B_2]PSN98836.1 MAG: amino acid transporter [Candidatus Marsarchaeota G2 archaeon ECH_B_3]PSO00838.1 MAG: amino acid transporter [Candidatus Marsarchaeota G2 archaeon ECH_B_1]